MNTDPARRSYTVSERIEGVASSVGSLIGLGLIHVTAFLAGADGVPGQAPRQQTNPQPVPEHIEG